MMNDEDIPEKLRRIRGLELDLFRPGGTPSEAAGTYRGRSFMFYARFNHWQLVIAPLGDVDPFYIGEVEDTDLDARHSHWGRVHVDAHAGAFIRSCYPYGDDAFAASYLPTDAMAQILADCFSDFDLEMAGRPSDEERDHAGVQIDDIQERVFAAARRAEIETRQVDAAQVDELKRTPALLWRREEVRIERLYLCRWTNGELRTMRITPAPLGSTSEWYSFFRTQKRSTKARVRNDSGYGNPQYVEDMARHWLMDWAPSWDSRPIPWVW